MEHYAHVTIEVSFKEPVDRRIGKATVEDFSMLFDCDDLYAENYDSENYHSFKAEFNSNRVAPIAGLQQFCNSNNLSMKATAYGSMEQYSEVFQLTATV